MVVAVVLSGILIIVIIIKRNRPDTDSGQGEITQRPELSTTRHHKADHETFKFSSTVQMENSSGDLNVGPSGTESVMTCASEPVSPPTYEESQSHPVAPSNY